MKKYLFGCWLLAFFTMTCAALPKNFVYLRDVDPTIIQEIRYASDHNFIGKRIKGYEQATCILTRPCAYALKQIQQALIPNGLSLKVYDCYRPQMAVHEFIQWAKRPEDQSMKAEFYPRVAKSELFAEGYVAPYSGHSRGSTVDLTIVNLRKKQQAKFIMGQNLVHCFLPYGERFRDNSIDMGSGYDCLDPVAHYGNTKISKEAQRNRSLLNHFMVKYGFLPYDKEWWHFSLKNEPYKKRYFNFPVY